MSNPIDPKRSSGFIAGMFARTLRTVMRETVEELVTPQFQELKRGQERLEAKLDFHVQRLDTRIDLLTQQQHRMVEQVAALRSASDVSATLLHRIDRLEDKVFG
ncbi:MAG TPA: hypothetical protein VFE31_10435 [Opitutaceae bacterium]|jgi:hypothetical protein|nr:hypothetical protein [Opitutaceae bacterium]